MKNPLERIFHRRKDDSKEVSSTRQNDRGSGSASLEGFRMGVKKVFWNRRVRRYIDLILAIFLTLAIVAGISLLVYDFFFLEMFKSANNVTAYFPWSYGINFSSSVEVLTLFFVGLGVSVVTVRNCNRRTGLFSILHF